MGAAGWLLLNYANVDALVARYNIGRGLDTGAILSASDGRLGALPALEELLEAQPEETELRQAVETLPGQRQVAGQPIGRPGRWPLGGGSSRNKNRPDSVCRPGGRPSAQRVPVQKKVKRPLAYTVPAPSSTVMDTRQVVRPRCSTRARAVT
mgnify:CR=1 FL=1